MIKDLLNSVAEAQRVSSFMSDAMKDIIVESVNAGLGLQMAFTDKDFMGRAKKIDPPNEEAEKLYVRALAFNSLGFLISNLGLLHSSLCGVDKTAEIIRPMGGGLDNDLVISIISQLTDDISKTIALNPVIDIASKVSDQILSQKEASTEGQARDQQAATSDRTPASASGADGDQYGKKSASFTVDVGGEVAPGIH